MPILGMTIRSIKAERKAPITGSVKVNNNTKLKELEERNLPAIGKEGLVISFDYGDDIDNVISYRQYRKMYQKMSLGLFLILVFIKYQFQIIDIYYKLR